jgi:hypothetical protein
MVRPVRTVRVTTKEQFDAALARADQITVEGDDKLLSYAVNKASGDPTNRVAFELAGFDPEADLGLVALMPRIVPAPTPPPAPAPRSGLRRAIVIAAAALIGFIVVGSAIDWYVIRRQASQGVAFEPSSQSDKDIGNEIARRLLDFRLPDSSGFWANLPTLLWPLVAIVAIIALFLIARQAISSGRNVTIQWKVTEKVSGRLVITKVRERAPKQQAAA